MRPLATSRRVSTVCVPQRRLGVLGTALRPRLATALTPSRHRLRAFRAAGPRSVHPWPRNASRAPGCACSSRSISRTGSATGSRPGRRKALSDPALRPMRAESLHVTLCFLSYHPEKALPRITELVRRSPGAPGRAALRGRALGAAEGQAAPVHARRRERSGGGAAGGARRAALEAERFYEPEKRAFWPHVTVARVRSERLRPSAVSAGEGPPAAREPRPRSRSPRRSPALRSRPTGSLPFRSQAPGGRVRVPGGHRLAVPCGTRRGDERRMADERASLKAADKEAKAKDAALEAAVKQIEQRVRRRLGDEARRARRHGRRGDPDRGALARPRARHRRRAARPDRRDLRPRVLGQDDARLPHHRRGPGARRRLRVRRRRARDRPDLRASGSASTPTSC